MKTNKINKTYQLTALDSHDNWGVCQGQRALTLSGYNRKTKTATNPPPVALHVDHVVGADTQQTGSAANRVVSL